MAQASFWSRARARCASKRCCGAIRLRPWPSAHATWITPPEGQALPCVNGSDRGNPCGRSAPAASRSRNLRRSGTRSGNPSCAGPLDSRFGGFDPRNPLYDLEYGRGRCVEAVQARGQRRDHLRAHEVCTPGLDRESRRRLRLPASPAASPASPAASPAAAHRRPFPRASRQSPSRRRSSAGGAVRKDTRPATGDCKAN